jgi:hypothetical protein
MQVIKVDEDSFFQTHDDLKARGFTLWRVVEIAGKGKRIYEIIFS